jgi:tetratricopeptide (TPR) repeat protein
MSHRRILLRGYKSFRPFRHLGLAILICAMTPVCYGQQSKPDPATGFGQVHLQISCQPEAQAQFDQALAMLHTFSFPEATKTFAAVAQQDPDCGMAYWGLAASAVGSLYGGRPGPQASQGEQAAEKAALVGAKTPRERGYIAAIGVFYKDSKSLSYEARVRAYATALQRLHQEYPDDHEAEIFYAYALSALGSPTDQTFKYEMQGAEILEKLRGQIPNHPGVLHYLLHCYDHTPLAARGLKAARQFTGMAPSSPHAAEFPAHIFSRLGLWQESIQANQAGLHFTEDIFFKPHAADFLLYSYLQTGQDAEAARVVENASHLKFLPHLLDAYAAAVIPSRYAVERQRWDEAASLALPAANIDWKLFPHAEAALVFSRALGEARLGKVDLARNDLERLEELKRAVSSSVENEGVWQRFWATEIQVNHDMVKAWLLYRQGEIDAAVQLLRQAADKEDSMEKDPVMPATIIPARQLLGEMLLDVQRPREALEAFEAALKNEPARYWELFGAAQAAERSGDEGRASFYYTQLIRQTQGTDGTRESTNVANEFLARHGIFTTLASGPSLRVNPSY